MSNIILSEESSPNFINKEGRIFLVRCPNINCRKENYSIAVASGICSFCGYNLNETKILKDENK